jgi:hypothetical protein
MGYQQREIYSARMIKIEKRVRQKINCGSLYNKNPVNFPTSVSGNSFNLMNHGSFSASCSACNPNEHKMVVLYIGKAK